MPSSALKKKLAQSGARETSAETYECNNPLFSLQDALGNFFFNDTATTEIYTLSLHDALPISVTRYNEVGQAVATADALGHVSTMHYDAFGNVDATRQYNATLTEIGRAHV